MDNLNRKLIALGTKIQANQPIKIAILGLGSVGNYLLNYLNSWDYNNIKIYIGTKGADNAVKDVNISKVASIIRDGLTKDISVKEVDLDNVDSIKEFINVVNPDFIVNTSRVYTGLKYGSISWNNIRAYGLWTPLAIRFIKNIMKAHKLANSNAIVINASYSDAVLPWLKSSGENYPDFGSGNLNHLIPRIKMAVASELNINDIENIKIHLATSHFHDVVISKEGQTEGCDPIIHISYKDETVHPDMNKIWSKCAIEMPSDAQRNMMNASSNFEIIKKIVSSAVNKKAEVIHTPGVSGLLGGYPVIVDYTKDVVAQFDEQYFSLDEMISCNRKSIYLDGIEKIENGELFYTDELIAKVKKAFGTIIPKSVKFENIETVAQFIINNIIEPNVAK